MLQKFSPIRLKKRFFSGLVHSVSEEKRGRENFIRDGPDFQNQTHYIFASDKFRRSRRIRNTFEFIAGVGEEGSAL